MAGQGSGGNVIAAICNIFFPGLGQLVQGRILAALVFFLNYGRMLQLSSYGNIYIFMACRCYFSPMVNY